MKSKHFQRDWHISKFNYGFSVTFFLALFVVVLSLAANPAQSAVLYDNGPLVTHPGGGAGGYDASAVQTALGMGTLGATNSVSTVYRVADDFTVPAGGWTIDQIVFYAYQTGSTTTSTMTSVNYRIWTGPPGQAGSTIVFGDTTTNRLTDGTWSNIYRVTDTGLTGSTRPIMACTVSAGVTLSPGTYWLDWQAGGSLTSGPFAPPITILGQTTTGNAMQFTGSIWVALLDTGTATPQGLPFLLINNSAAEIGVFRNGTWFTDINGNGAWDGCGTDGCWSLGMTGDIPFTVPLAGESLIGVFRNGAWFVDGGNHTWDGCGTDNCYSFGMAGDTPVVGAWAASWWQGMGVFRNGAWFLDYNGSNDWDGCGTDSCVSFGMAGDIPVVGDWNSSGTSKVGVFRNGTWFLDYNGSNDWDGCGTDSCVSFGMAGDIPAVGDWSGSGTIKLGVFRNGTWFLDYNGNGAWDGCGTDACYSFGASGDKPVVGIW